jgi:hypothetical protein
MFNEPGKFVKLKIALWRQPETDDLRDNKSFSASVLHQKKNSFYVSLGSCATKATNDFISLEFTSSGKMKAQERHYYYYDKFASPSHIMAGLLYWTTAENSSRSNRLPRAITFSLLVCVFEEHYSTLFHDFSTERHFRVKYHLWVLHLKARHNHANGTLCILLVPIANPV